MAADEKLAHPPCSRFTILNVPRTITLRERLITFVFPVVYRSHGLIYIINLWFSISVFLTFHTLLRSFPLRRVSD